MRRHLALEFYRRRLDADVYRVFQEAIWKTLSPEAERRLALHDYLDEVASAGDISKETAERAWEAWLHLNSKTGGCLPVPDAAPGPNGELLLVWDRGELHLELEIMPDGSPEFFSRNRTTGTLWGEDYRPDAPLSAGAREHLRMFL